MDVHLTYLMTLCCYQKLEGLTSQKTHLCCIAPLLVIRKVQAIKKLVSKAEKERKEGLKFG